MHKNINIISDNYLCSNCGACYSICPKDAVEFKSTNIGRLYATTNDKCISCGLCMKVCPSFKIKPAPTIEDILGCTSELYTGVCLDQKLYTNGQSGGLCATTLKYLFETNKIDAAIVCKSTYGFPHPKVESIIIEDASELMAVQKSCYTPVPLLKSLKHTYKYNRLALVGLPCHIQGARKLANISPKFQNIKYYIGLICDRTLTAAIFDIIHSNIKSQVPYKINWRHKGYTRNGVFHQYHNAPLVVADENGNEHIFTKSHRISLKEFLTPPRCRVCYDKINTDADIVLGDPWRLESTDTKYGESLILTRTKLGSELIKSMIENNIVRLKKRRTEDIITSQQLCKRQKESSCFFKALLNLRKSDVLNQIFSVKNNQDVIAVELIMEYEKKIEDFTTAECLSKEDIIKKGNYIIRRYKNREKMRNCLLFRIVNKIKNLIQ